MTIGRKNSGRDRTIPRLLLVDDNVAIHEDFRQILEQVSVKDQETMTLEGEMFGPAPAGNAGDRQLQALFSKLLSEKGPA